MRRLLGKISRRVKIGFVLFFCIVAGIFMAALGYMAESAEHVVINEVCSNNFSVICNEDGEYSDYVELYNPAFLPVSLTGFSLSDNSSEPYKCCLDSVIIPARGYLLIWLDGSEEGKVCHASFRLSREGETIYFSNQDGKIIDSAAVPELTYNTVYAREKDGSEAWELQTPTAGEANETAETVLAREQKEPEFSAESGFYDEPFMLTMTAEDNRLIFYTLDGSEPTVASTQYTGAVLIEDASKNENVYSARTDLTADMDYVPSFVVDKATVVRAIAYDAESNTVSKSVTKTYFVGFDEKEEYNGYGILSLVTDPDNLFDSRIGIYGNGAAMEEYEAAAGFIDGEVPGSYEDEEGNIHYRYMSTNAYYTGKEWEREAYLAYFDTEHSLRLSQGAGIRISGESTRNAAQKSFNIFAREIYDEESVLMYDFFEGMEYTSIKIRNGGTDHAGSKIYDGFLQSFAQGRAVTVQACTPCVVFLNGEYWGLYNIRERYKEDYFYNHYGISENNVWMIDSGSASIGSWAAWNDYNDMLTFISENDMTKEENYAKACQLVDMQSLIDWYCIQLYINNDDTAFDKNIGLWRTIRTGDGEYEDGRWRFMLFDLDESLKDPSINTFEESEWWKKDFGLMDEGMIKSLMRNEVFAESFRESFIEIADTVYDYDRVHEELLKWKEAYKTQVVKSHQRFLSAEADDAQYDAFIEQIDSFFKERKDYMLSYLEKELEKFREESEG